jgi:alginate O-acetyltransferase complex protein AlgI
MLFNSYHFLIFFPIVTLLYFILPHKIRWFFLLVSSCYFYMAFIPIYILILGFTITVDYFAGIYIDNSEGRRRKLYLICSLIANIGVLAIFKYYNFINNNFSFLLQGIGVKNPMPYFPYILPIGLSFHTFQAMSYTIEVYRRNFKAERNFGIFSLYVMFFPQLVAGPIERPYNLLVQLRKKVSPEFPRILNGLKIIAFGFFKKVVIADNIATYVDTIYNHPSQYYGATLSIAVILFAFQVYCDFSGYTDIAIGTAKILGIDLMINFKRPFFSKSVSEFWRRWHISLMSWFRDYIYFSLGGNRVRISRMYLNFFIVFFFSGLWHGANWTFLVWGISNGLLVIYEHLTRNIRMKLFNFLYLNRIVLIKKIIQVSITFGLFSLTCIFFRAKSLTDAFTIFNNIFKYPSHNLGIHFLDVFNQTWTFLLLVGFLLGVESIERKKPLNEYFGNKPVFIEIAFYTLIIFLTLIYSNFHEVPFIYFIF